MPNTPQRFSESVVFEHFFLKFLLSADVFICSLGVFSCLLNEA